MSAAVAGGVIAFYQLGYGIAAFGVGPLLDAGVALPTIFAFAAVVAARDGPGVAGLRHVRAAKPIHLNLPLSPDLVSAPA